MADNKPTASGSGLGGVGAAYRTSVLGLSMPVVTDEPGTLVRVKAAAAAVSELIGGGLLDEARGQTGDGSGFTVYLDDDRVTKGLPVTERPAARRVAAGYVVVPDGLDPSEAEWWVRRWGDALGGFAAREGYTLGALFNDVEGQGEPGLYDLVGHVRQGRAAAVVVPDLPTLTRSACLAGADRLTAARFLHAPVLTVYPDPADTADTGPADTGPADTGPAQPAYADPVEIERAAHTSAAQPGAGWFQDGEDGPAPARRHGQAPAHPRRRRTDRERW